MFSTPFLVESFIPSQINWLDTIKIACVLAVVIFAVGAILRAFLGRGSSLTRSVSATLNILLIYLTVIILFYYFPAIRTTLNGLPFITITPDDFQVWILADLSEQVFYASLLRMAVLAMLVNALEFYLPKGRNLLGWYLYRILTGLSAFALYQGTCYIINLFAPEIFGSWAKPVIFTFWGIIILIAVLKLLMSALLSVLNPIVGACYAFFFGNPFGKQFSKAILTTVFMILIVYYLNHAGFHQVIFSKLSLAAYGPTSLIILIALYFFGSIL